MPDISMCADSACPSRGGCYRFQAKPSAFQAFGNYSVVRNGADKCASYWPTEPAKTKGLDAALAD